MDEYIGETSQPLHKRMAQHRRHAAGGLQSAVYEHLEATGHSFKTENVKIIDKESDWFKRGVKEAFWIKSKTPVINRQGGARFKLSNSWNRAIRLNNNRGRNEQISRQNAS